MDYINNDENSKKAHCSKTDGLPIMGIFLIGLGIVFLFDRMNLIPNYWRHIILSWQSLLIFIGSINIFKRHARFPGIILILIGSAFLIPKIIDIPFETRQLIWPIVLISIGLTIVFKARNIKPPQFFKPNAESINNSQEKIEEVAIFGGGKRIITSNNLKGGNITAIFGGLELDLTRADIDGDIAVLEVACIFGGTTIIVKSEWDVQVQVASIMGGFSDKRKVYKRGENAAPSKILIIKGTAIFGGGEVKAY